MYQTLHSFLAPDRIISTLGVRLQDALWEIKKKNKFVTGLKKNTQGSSIASPHIQPTAFIIGVVDQFNDRTFLALWSRS